MSQLVKSLVGDWPRRAAPSWGAVLTCRSVLCCFALASMLGLGLAPASTATAFAATSVSSDQGMSAGKSQQAKQVSWLAPERFLVKPRVMQVTLSPDGSRVAYSLREDYGVSVWTLQAATGQKQKRMESRLAKSLAWARDGSGLFVETVERVAFLPLDGTRPSFVWHRDSVREQEYRGVDPVFPHHILVTEKAQEYDYRLLRLDLSGEQVPILRSETEIGSFLLSQDGQVTYLAGVEGVESVIFHRANPDDLEDKGREVFRCGVLEPCGILAIEPGTERLLLQAQQESGLRKLFAVNTTSGEWQALHGDPLNLADLASVQVDPVSGVPLLASYRTDRRRSYPLSRDLRVPLERLLEQLPGGELDIRPRALGKKVSGTKESLEEGSAGGFWLIGQDLAQFQHRRFFLYDPLGHRLTPILEDERLSVDTIDEASLVDTKHMSYQASDGLRVHGFLTLPRGRNLEKAPLVARIHGGPWSQSRSGNDPMTQFLANRGYIVFEPNFRASTGYGLDYVLAAKGEFGDGRVHLDIVEGVRHLLAKGVGDPERVGIVGHSFGGFSVLGAVAFSPELFRVGIASAPAIDLLRSLEDLDPDRRLSNGLSQAEVIWHYVVDREDKDAVERLRESSPENRLEDTARPLLIIAGALDKKIPLVDVEHYALALDGLGRDVSLLVDYDSGHSFEKPLLREAYFFLLERFLGHHLGVPTIGNADPRLREYLEMNLSILGDSLKKALALQAADDTE